MNLYLFFTIFIGLAVIYTLIGLYASRNINTLTDYFLAGRNLGFWQLTFTLLATQIGGGMLLGTAQEAYIGGLYGFTYTLGMCGGFLLLGLGFATKLQRLQVATTAQLFETHYGSILLRKCASLLSIITLSGILIAQIIGSKKLLLSLGLENELLFIIFWLFTIWYTMAGGLKAVVWTDTVQVLFIIFLFSGLFIYKIWHNPLSLFDTFTTQSTLFTTQSFTIATLSSTFLMPILFSLIEQDLAQRFFAAKSAFVARSASLGASVALLAFSTIPVYFGMQARAIGIAPQAANSPLVAYIATFVPDIILIFAICAIMAAITSTADSLLCAISSNIATDFDVRFIGTDTIKRSRIITTIIGLVTLGLSYIITANIISVLVGSYELSVSCLLIPLLFCYFNRASSYKAAWASIIAGAIGFIGFRLISVPGVPREVCTLIAGLLVYIIVDKINKQK